MIISSLAVAEGMQSAKVAQPTIRLVITKKADLRLIRSTNADFQI